jgi:hypothetical protein
MAKLKLSDHPDLAMAAGRDAANRHMHSENRKVWNREDFNVAVETYNSIMEDKSK